jgi:hypothetical protein
MKAALFSVLLLWPLLGWSQIFRVDPDTRKVTYSEVTEVDGTPKEELFDRARKWFDQQYAYAQEVSMSMHEEEGEMEIYGNFPLKIGLSTGTVFYKLTLSVKEDKYRYLLSDFTFQASNSVPVAFENHRMHPQMRVFGKTDEKVQLLLASLHQKMIRKVTASVDDW